MIATLAQILLPLLIAVIVGFTVGMVLGLRLGRSLANQPSDREAIAIAAQRDRVRAGERLGSSKL